MRLRYLLILILLGTLSSGITTYLIINSIRPDGSIFAQLLFTFTSWFTVFGAVSLGLLIFRARKASPWHIRSNVSISTRQALLLATIVILSLWLMHFDHLKWWLLSIIIALGAYVEYLLLPKKL